MMVPALLGDQMLIFRSIHYSRKAKFLAPLLAITSDDVVISIVTMQTLEQTLAARNAAMGALRREL